MAHTFIGRKIEQEILVNALNSSEAEMISVIGRRRVGKTFLIKSVYQERITFEMSGIQHAPKEEQLRNFASRLKEAFPHALLPQVPPDWFEAFLMLIDLLNQQDQTEKEVVFLDELPWMATHKSGFLRGLDYFWNSWAVNQNIVVVICGSAASWMIDNVIRHKGGLHNRVTKRIHLKPFTLAETEKYLDSRGVHVNHYQLLQLYMAMGGIPHYLKQVQAGKSAAQTIDDVCFSDQGLLRDEFQSLYPALFANADYHIAMIRALANKHSGMSRQEIVEASKLPQGGRISKVLNELEQSGFISAYRPFGKKKKDKLYRLTDEYSLFYLKFIEQNIEDGEDIWLRISQRPSWKSWSGYAFENICFKHLPQIKKALGISGVYTSSSSFLKKGTKDQAGTQIDLLIDRNDQIINLVEIKFSQTAFSITKAYAHTLREKVRIFTESTKTRKQIFPTMVTTFGLAHNKHSLGLTVNEVEMDALFEE